MNKYTTYINSLSTNEREKLFKEMLLILNPTDDEKDLINDIVLFESRKTLEEHGQTFSVKSVKKRGRPCKIGLCYATAGVKMRDKDYKYVEGYIIAKNEESIITAHAWNVDTNGNHIDYTIPNPDCYNYFGIVVPTATVMKIGCNRGTWFAVLPFIEASDLNM